MDDSIELLKKIIRHLERKIIEVERDLEYMRDANKQTPDIYSKSEFSRKHGKIEALKDSIFYIKEEIYGLNLSKKLSHVTESVEKMLSHLDSNTNDK